MNKLMVILPVPILVGVLTYVFFQAIQDAYTAEAHLRVELPAYDVLPVSDETPSAEIQAIRRTESLVDLIQSDRVLQLLAYALAVHDLTDAQPFLSHDHLDGSYTKKNRLHVASLLMYRLERVLVETGQSREDSLIQDVLQRYGYQPGNLRQQLLVSRTPDSNIIRVQAQGSSPEHSAFMVETLCREFIRYYTQVEQERLERTVEMLREMADQKRVELDQRNERLRREQRSLRQDPSEALQQLLREIDELERSRHQELEQIQALRGRMQEQQARLQSVVVPVRQDPAMLTREEVAQALGTAMARLELIDKRLGNLRKTLSEQEASALGTLESEVARAEDTYLMLLRKLRETEEAITQLPYQVSVVSQSTTRYPHPAAARLLAFMAGICSLLLWLIVLFQFRYLPWSHHSPRKSSGSDSRSDSQAVAG
ncbi:MAG: hypothetical protein OHK0039_25960 [Bacteroidia bacterium]